MRQVYTCGFVRQGQRRLNHRQALTDLHRRLAWPPPPGAPVFCAYVAPGRSMARRIIGQPTFFLIAPGPILGPRDGENRIPREKYSDVTYFHNFSTDF